jgi:hypothetical protein
MKVRQEVIGDYFKKIKTANKEAIKKEIFKDLLNRLYSEDNVEKTVKMTT